MITNKHLFSLLLLSLSLFSYAAFAQEASQPLENAIFPIPLHVELDSAKVELGRSLFFDKRLSKNNDLSCADCHQLKYGGDSGRVSDISHGHTDYRINTPSIFNARYNFRQNWDGSDTSLREQIEKIFNQHPPFNTDFDTLIRKYREDKALSSRFSTIYQSGLTKESLLESFVEFEKSLITPNSRFDRYLMGDKNALSKDERAGYRLFKSLGCISCHQGINIGGNLYQKFGVFYNYLAERGDISKADLGLKNISGREIDTSVFKVPSLRNVAVTAPYLHNGSAATLEEAIFIIGKTQLGRNLELEQIRLIKAFLLTLTGEYKNTLLTDNKQ